MATGHADDAGGSGEPNHESDRDADAGPPAVLGWYGLAFGAGSIVFLAGAANAVGLYTGERYASSEVGFMLTSTVLASVGGALVLYALYGTIRTAGRTLAADLAE
jgi:hypothetical protein